MRAVKYPLTQEMAAQGLTVTKLAERLGVTKGAVGRAPSPDNNIEAFTLFAMAEALGCEWQVSLRRRENATEADARTHGRLIGIGGSNPPATRPPMRLGASRSADPFSSLSTLHRTTGVPSEPTAEPHGALTCA